MEGISLLENKVLDPLSVIVDGEENASMADVLLTVNYIFILLNLVI